MRLCIADPPYPPFIGAGGRKNRASRWYGAGQRSRKDRPSDFHPQAAEWDCLERHRRLFLDLVRDYDGFAIATSADGVAAYGPLPPEARLLCWVKPNAQPGANRILSTWEAVIVLPPIGRRSNRGGKGSVPGHLVCPIRRGFIGGKPKAWTEWVLSALGYDPLTDTVDDLFPGSGAVARAIKDAEP